MNMMRIIKQVSLVVKLIDNIDGKPIKSGDILINNSKHKAINKKDGYYVFVNIDYQWDFIKIGASQYEERIISNQEFFNSCIDNEIIVGLSPSNLSPRYSSFLKIDGHIQNKEIDKVMIAALDKNNEYLLVKDSEKNSKHIYINNKHSFFEGKFYIVDNREDYNGEIVNVYDYDIRDESTLCSIKDTLTKGYNIGTKIYKVYTAEVHNNEFRLLLKDNMEDDINLLILIDEDKPIYMKANRQNRKQLKIFI